MRTIFKYPLEVDDTVVVMMPQGAQIIKIGKQGGGFGELVLWAVVDTDNPETRYTLHCRGTGHPMPDQAVEHIASVIDGPFVWHVFRSTTSPDANARREKE